MRPILTRIDTEAKQVERRHKSQHNAPYKGGAADMRGDVGHSDVVALFAADLG